jgi:hypothetical protein
MNSAQLEIQHPLTKLNVSKCEYSESCAFFGINPKLYWERSHLCFTKKSMDKEND